MKRIKRAGTWALPFTEAQAIELNKLVHSLKDGVVISEPVTNILHNLLGDDELFDNIGVITDTAAKDIERAIINKLRTVLEDYTEDPTLFKDVLDPEAETILRSMSD